MKPFNLEAAQRGEPIITRDGNDDVVFAGYNPKAIESQRVACWINENLRGFHETGEYGTFKRDQYPLDLFMKPKKKQLWARVARNDGVPVVITASCYDHIAFKVCRTWLTDPVLLHEWEE